MSVTPRDLLALARHLQQAGAPEVDLRCAAARAYYAALHEVNLVFDQQPGSYRADGESSHAEIIGRTKAYGNGLRPGRESARTIANTLPRMRRQRNRADYELNCTFSIDDCSGMLARAEQVLQLCDDVQTKSKAA